MSLSFDVSSRFLHVNTSPHPVVFIHGVHGLRMGEHRDLRSQTTLLIEDIRSYLTKETFCKTDWAVGNDRC